MRTDFHVNSHNLISKITTIFTTTQLVECTQPSAEAQKPAWTNSKSHSLKGLSFFLQCHISTIVFCQLKVKETHKKQSPQHFKKHTPLFYHNARIFVTMNKDVIFLKIKTEKNPNQPCCSNPAHLHKRIKTITFSLYRFFCFHDWECNNSPRRSGRWWLLSAFLLVGCVVRNHGTKRVVPQLRRNPKPCKTNFHSLKFSLIQSCWGASRSLLWS